MEVPDRQPQIPEFAFTVLEHRRMSRSWVRSISCSNPTLLFLDLLVRNIAVITGNFQRPVQIVGSIVPFFPDAVQNSEFIQCESIPRTKFVDDPEQLLSSG